MATVRSRYARRGRTGRKASGVKIARRRITVHKHHHRRYAGVKGGTSKPGIRRKVTHKARVNKTGRRTLTHKARARRGQGKKYVKKPGGRHGHRKFKGRHLKHKRRVLKKLHRRSHAHRHSQHRRKSLHRRIVRKGLHRHFRGHRKSLHPRHLTHRRIVRKGLHRRPHIRQAKPKAAATISAASYLSMF